MRAASSACVSPALRRASGTRSLGAIATPFSPAEFARYIRSEYEKWATVVAQTGAKEP